MSVKYIVCERGRPLLAEEKPHDDKMRNLAERLNAISITRESHDADWYSFLLKEPTDAKLFVRREYANRKAVLNISGSYPMYIDGEGHKTTVWPNTVWVEGRHLNFVSIGCSPNKSSEQLAADIRRRFIPDYYSVWNACKRNADIYGAQVVYGQMAIQKFLTITGGHIYGQSKDKVTFARGSIDRVSHDVTKPPTCHLIIDDVTEVELRQIMKALVLK